MQALVVIAPFLPNVLGMLQNHKIDQTLIFQAFGAGQTRRAAANNRRMNCMHRVSPLILSIGIIKHTEAIVQSIKSPVEKLGFFILNSMPNQITIKSAAVNAGCTEVPNTAKATDAPAPLPSAS